MCNIVCFAELTAAPVKPDPWAQFSPASPDPRVLFLVHPGPASSPLPLPLHPDDFSSSLKTAERRYLSQNVRIDVANKQVCRSSFQTLNSVSLYVVCSMS